MRRLFDDLADLDDAGGITAAAAGLWSDRKLRQNLTEIDLLRRMLRDEATRGRNEQEDGD